MGAFYNTDAAVTKTPDLMTAKWRGAWPKQTAPELVTYYFPAPEPPNLNRGTLLKVPTEPRWQMMPVLQQDHSQYLRFKRMI